MVKVFVLKKSSEKLKLNSIRGILFSGKIFVSFQKTIKRVPLASGSGERKLSSVP